MVEPMKNCSHQDISQESQNFAKTPENGPIVPPWKWNKEFVIIQLNLSLTLGSYQRVSFLANHMEKQFASYNEK